MNASSASRPLGLLSVSSSTQFQELWELWKRNGQSCSGLVGLVKAELQQRFAQGERPAVAAYLDAFPALRDDSNWVLSLLYEEYCLLEEAGEAPSPDSFCDRYEPWRDSLISQLNYHRVISQAAGGMPRLPRFPEPGEYFKTYHLRSILGQGGAARVFLAENEALGRRPSALKISANRGEEPSIMARLKHRNIMEVYSVDFDEETGLRGLDMPYLPGLPLDQILQRMRLTPPEARTAQTLLDAIAPEGHTVDLDQLGWADFPHGSYVDACLWLTAKLADALAHAHDRDVLHRDVKPANILISCSDGPQLFDFNLAHDPHTPERAESALRGGTLPYMAPEQLRAFLDPNHWDDVGPSADLYALGLVLRELLIGTRPEAPPANVPLPRTINDLLDVRCAGWPPTRIDNPNVPYALDAILARCLACDPSDRYPSARALAEDLRALLQRQPLIHEYNPSHRERLGFWLHRNRRRLVARATTTLILCGGIAVALAGNAIFAPENVAATSVSPEVDHLDLGTLYYERSQSDVFSEQQARDFRSQATTEFRAAIHHNPSTLEAWGDNLRAYHGLALIARDEGDEKTFEQMLARAIGSSEAPGQADVSDLGLDEWMREHRAYVANLYLQKILMAIGKFEPLLRKTQIRSKEAQNLAVKLREVLTDVDAAFNYAKEAPLEMRIDIHRAAAYTYGLILTQAIDGDDRDRLTREFETIVDRALDQIEHEDSQGELIPYARQLNLLRSELASWDHRMSQVQ